VDTLIDAHHNGQTEVRFSLNTQRIIENYEHRTASARLRIEAGARLAEAGYPVGFLIAPVFLYENWQEEYVKLLEDLKKEIPTKLEYPVTFEVISHRFTTRAKSRILEIFPETSLDMNEELRTFKFGQFGYGKYVYTKDSLKAIKLFFSREIDRIFDHKEIKYII
jgi:spore photoproduct lyase